MLTNRRNFRLEFHDLLNILSALLSLLSLQYAVCTPIYVYCLVYLCLSCIICVYCLQCIFLCFLLWYIYVMCSQLSGIGATGSFKLSSAFTPSPSVLQGNDTASDYEDDMSVSDVNTSGSQTTYLLIMFHTARNLTSFLDR